MSAKVICKFEMKQSIAELHAGKLTSAIHVKHQDDL